MGYFVFLAVFRRPADQVHRARRGHTQGVDLPLEGMPQHLVHGFHKAQRHFLADVLRNVGQILLIILREDHLEEPVTMRRQQFLF